MWLDNYSITAGQLAQSFIFSEYANRHYEVASKNGDFAWFHWTMATIENIPVLGLLVSLIEVIAAYFFKNVALHSTTQTSCTSLTGNFQPCKWFWHGSQEGCSRDVSSRIVEKLRKKLPRPSHIVLNKEKVRGSLKGGACSAMALDFLGRWFTYGKEKSFSKRIEKLQPYYQGASTNVCLAQAVFNTVEVSQRVIDGVVQTDSGLDKIQTLAGYYFLNVIASTEAIDMQLASAFQNFSQLEKALPEGEYLIRMIQPADNEKLEVHGHSMVYIRRGGLSALYDPNYGACAFEPANAALQLYNRLKIPFEMFNTNQLRFFKLQPQGSCLV